ncbi:MAG: hypothetical protein ACFCUG_16455 [Thiotrichales bacterium]
MKDKIRRTITSILPVASNRRGSCNNCGACCKLPTQCRFLRFNDSGESYCGIYKVRPLNCRKYPRSAAELITADTCGFWFEEVPEQAESPAFAVLKFVPLKRFRD